MKTEPWLTPEGMKIWKTESQYWQWLRGSLRRLWGDYPLRKEWKTRQLRLITPEEKASKKFHPSTKNLGQCFYCQEWFAGSKLECDHKTPSDGCKTKETAESFLWYCGGGAGDDWVLSCKPCHKLKTHSERYGLTLNEAVIEKTAIELCKQKKDLQWLRDRGLQPASSQAKRRIQVTEELRREQNESDGT